MTGITTVLLEMNRWLEKVSPDELDELNEPASAEAVITLNEAYGGRVPEDVLMVYAWHDGGEIPDPWWELSSIDEVIRVKELHDSMPDLQEQANWWSENWIPVGTDYDGNHLCVDLDGCFDGIPGQVLVYMHDESERVILAPSLGVYLELLLRACRDDILAYNEDEGFKTDDNQDAWNAFLSIQIDGYPRKAMAQESFD